MILWTHVACAHEESLPRDAHPQCDRSRAAYLQHLQTLGYVLSAVEQQIIDNTQPPADQPPTSRRPAAGQPPAEQQSAEQEPAEQEPAEQEAGRVAAGRVAVGRPGASRAAGPGGERRLTEGNAYRPTRKGQP